MTEKNEKENKLLSLTNDAVMKLFFTNKENEEQLRQFLKATTHLTDDDLATIDIKDPKLTKQHVQEKDFIVDIRLTSTSGEKVNIEIQARNHDGFKHRMIAYNARQYASQLPRGKHYIELKSSISLIVTNFSMFDDTDEYYEHILFRRKNNKVFTTAQQFYIMDLTKLPKELSEAKLQWGRLFRVRTKEELQMLMNESEEMKVAGERLLRLSADEDAQEIARAREESQWAWEHTLHATEARSKEEGRIEGHASGHASGLIEGEERGEHKKAIETAKNFLKMGLSPEKVAEGTKLELAFVKGLIVEKNF